MRPQNSGRYVAVERNSVGRAGLSIRKVATALTAIVPLLAVVIGMGAPTVALADSTPWVAAGDVTMPRPTSGTATFAFPIVLVHPSAATVSVNYTTADGTARSTFDYQPVSGTAVFTPGKTSVTVNVTVNGSTLHTGDRYFYLNLSGPLHAVVQHNGQGTIIDPTSLPYLNVSDATATQGSGTSNSAVFNVSLTSPSANKVKVRYYTSNGSAAAGIDYTSTTGILTFPPSSTTQQVTVPITGVGIYQTSKYFYLNIYQPQNAALEDSQGQGTIFSNNHIAYVTSDDVTIPEPGSGTAIVNVPVRVTPLSNFPVTISYATSNGSAAAGTDYTTASGTLTIPAGVAQVTAPITVNASGLAATKYFVFSMSAPSPGATFIRSTSYVSITAGSYNQLSIGDVGVTAPASGTVTATFTVSLSPSSASTVGVNFATQDGSALAGTHYVATSGTLSFTAGQTSKTVSVTVKADTAQFADTQYYVNLSALTGGAVISPRGGTGYGQIQANAPAPAVWLAGAVVAKPASGTVIEAFPVTLTSVSPNTVTVNYSTSNGSAVAGTDYAAATGTLTFTPGITTQNVSVTVNGNTLAGADMYFYVTLASPTNAVLAGSQVQAFIQNPNRNPTLSINNVAVYKAQSGTASAKLTVTLSSASPNTVTVNYSTSNGSAIAGSDYTAASGPLTFAPGITSQSITIATTGNTIPTGDRYFYVTLATAVNAGMVSSQGQVDILDSSIVPYLSVSSTSVQKPSTGSANAVFTVNLSPTSPNTVTAHYATSDGSAIAGANYTAATGTVTFLPGTATQTVNVPVTASTVHTSDLYFYLSLSAPTNANLGQQSYNTATIIDPTFNPELTVDDAGVLKPASGTAVANFTVHLYPASPNTVTANYATSDGSGVAGVDYVATSGTLTFNPGDTSKTVPVTVNGSASSVPDRYFYLSVTSPTHAQTGNRNYGEGIIVDTVLPRSGLSYVSTQDVAVLKANSGTSTETFTVSLFPAATVPIMVNYATSDGSALAGAGDYVPARGTLTFAPGNLSKTVNVTVNGNTMSSGDKYFSLGLSAFTGPSSNFRGTGYGYVLSQQPDSRLWVGPDLTINRGTSGSSTVGFSVSLSSPQQFPVQVDYTTNDGTAVAPDGYTPDEGTLIFTPGQTTQSVQITVPGNPAYTTTQYFYFDISNVVNSSTANSGTHETAYVYNLDTFGITGKVIDTTGAGLAGVTVTRTGNNAPAVAVTTAGDGSFSILNTIDGVYTVTPTLGGSSFLPASASITIRGASGAVPVFLAYAGVGITGLVADSAGKAVAGVTVTRTGGGAGTAVVTTDALGYYAFGNVANGTAYVVTPSSGTYSFNPASYTFNVTGTTVKTLDFVALKGVIISGRVVSTGAVGVAGVTITRTGGGGPTVVVKTNSQGYYGFSSNPATVGGVTYTITPTKTGKTFTPVSAPATVTTTSNATGVNFTQN